MRHFLRATLAIAPLAQRVSVAAAQAVLVASPGCAHARAPLEATARIGAVALAAIARGADAEQPAAACTVHAPVIVAHGPEPPTGDWTPSAPQPTLRPSIRTPSGVGSGGVPRDPGTTAKSDLGLSPRRPRVVARGADNAADRRPRWRRPAARGQAGSFADPLGLKATNSSPTPMAISRARHRIPALSEHRRHLHM